MLAIYAVSEIFSYNQFVTNRFLKVMLSLLQCYQKQNLGLSVVRACVCAHMSVYVCVCVCIYVCQGSWFPDEGQSHQPEASPSPLSLTFHPSP